MAQIQKPSDLSLIWASAGDILNPGDAKYQTGWQVEIPPRQWENYVQNKQDQAIAHFNQHGIPVWDNATEYQANKSYVQGPTNGTIYQCILTNTDQNPETDLTNTYWIVAFASAGTFYTKAEADTTFLGATDNLADLTNAAAARTNLSVYSQAQTYTKTEVDAKTTVASTAQAQALTSNTTLITPLRLAEAFKGANQSLTSAGFQKLPGGLIIQWGQSATSAGTGTLVSLPVTFPNAIFIALATDRADTSASSLEKTSIGTAGFTTSGFNIISEIASSAFWVAIGY
jgi:hypothetical protein